MGNRIKLTQDFVRGALPNNTRTYFYDTEEKGLTLVITPKGTKSFVYTGRVNGRPDRVPAGRFPETTVEKAKANVLKIRSAISEGRDPREVHAVSRGRTAGVLTLGEFWEIYLEDHARKNRDRWKEDTQNFKNHFKSLARLPLNSITPEAVRLWHADIGSRVGQSAANKQVRVFFLTCFDQVESLLVSRSPSHTHNNPGDLLTEAIGTCSPALLGDVVNGTAQLVGTEDMEIDGIPVRFNKWKSIDPGCREVEYWQGVVINR